MKYRISIIVLLFTLLLSSCGSVVSSKQVETQVAATIASGQTATFTNMNQVETQVAATIAAGQTSTAVNEESIIKTLTAIAPSATNTLSPSPKPQNTAVSVQTPNPAANPETQNADAIAGSWSGTEGYSGKDPTQVIISIQSNCVIGSACGSISYPQYGCAGNIVLTKVKNNTTFVFRENITSGGDGCTSSTGGSNTLTLNSDGTLSLQYYFKDGKAGATGVLRK